MFIAMATAICSLRHRLCLTAVPRPNQPCIPSGSPNQVLVAAGGMAGMSTLLGGRYHSVIPHRMLVPAALRLGYLPKENHYTMFTTLLTHMTKQYK